MLHSLKILSVVSLLGVLSACNTMEGLGQDVKGAGESLEESASEHK